MRISILQAFEMGLAFGVFVIVVGYVLARRRNDGGSE